MKPKVLIIFTDIHLVYSPSTLNLYDALQDRFDTTILTFEHNPYYSSHKIVGKKIKYIPAPDENVHYNLIRRLFKKIELLILKKKNETSSLFTARAQKLVQEIEMVDAEIIAIDFFALWCVQKANKTAHFVSLEIKNYDQYRDKCEFNKIKSVIIQTQIRYDYLFKGLNLKTFLVQNAPNHIDLSLDINKRPSKKLIFCGSAMPHFGIFSCIEFIKDYPEYSLTVKGALPADIRNVIENYFKDLLDNKQLILSEQYLEADELNRFLEEYYIGFVFYDYFRFEFINTFNYKTAPSGKLFQYYNAGIPVVANNIIGLNSIEEFNAGIMINSLGSKTIKDAIDKIDSDYCKYATGAKIASKNFDFKKSIQPFIEYLGELTGTS